MDSEDKKEFSIRDQIAFAIMSQLMQRLQADNIMSYINYGKHGDLIEFDEKRFDRLIRMSYKLADIVRKHRLAAFE